MNAIQSALWTTFVILLDSATVPSIIMDHIATSVIQGIGDFQTVSNVIAMAIQTSASLLLECALIAEIMLLEALVTGLLFQISEIYTL